MILDEQYFVIAIAPDELSASMSILPGFPTGLELSGRLLKIFCRSKGIVSGIHEDILENIAESVKNGDSPQNVVFAEGILPFAGEKPSLELNFEFSKKPVEDESGRINYREISAIVKVSKGQILASKKRLKPAVNGVTVTGKVTQYPRVEDIPLTSGSNVHVEEGDNETLYIANTDGVLKYENHVLSVFPVLEIAEDVDFNIGNIRFTGDVKVNRDVLPDFIIEADGKISIWGSAVACKLSAGQDIEVRSGIIGKNKGEVTSQGNITCTFVENATLTAKGDIIVKNGIIGSTVNCDGILSVPMSKSRVVGSMIKASRGITLCNAGSRFDTSTSLTTGIHPEQEESYFQIKEKLESKLEEARTIEKRYGRSTLENRNFTQRPTPQIEADLKKWDFLKEEIRHIYEEMKVIEDAMYDYSAKIIVKENLFPRVHLKIGRFEMNTSQEYYKATVQYDPDEDRLVVI
jgi:uncharacterized protein (DUF342 family)